MVRSAIDDDDDHDNTAFWFLDSGEESPETSVEEEEEDGEGPSADDLRESNKAFWDQQLQALQAILYRTSSAETRVRRATKEVMRLVAAAGEYCRCRGRSGEYCGECLRREVREGLAGLGLDCEACVSRSLPHTYLEVVVATVRVIVEVGLRAEFQMAAAGDDYDRLAARLPEVYVGRADRLRDVAELMCAAAKRSMKERNMHLGPWRRNTYVLAKWLGRRMSSPDHPPPLPPPPPPPDAVSGRPRSSLLTFDLSEAGLRRTALAV